VESPPEPTASPQRPLLKPHIDGRATVQCRIHAAPAKLSSPVTPNVNDTRINVSDELGAFISAVACDFKQSSSWDSFIQKSRHMSDMYAEVAALPHPASRLLHQYRKRGVPVTMRNLPWSQQRRNAAIRRGAHLYAKQHTAFLRQEFTSMIKKGQWTVLPARLVRHMRKLRISPIGVGPQRDRRPRTIMDYSFCNVNEDTAPWAPAESMQFDRALY
jgi:hypothetical protein